MSPFKELVTNFPHTFDSTSGMVYKISSDSFALYTYFKSGSFIPISKFRE